MLQNEQGGIRKLKRVKIQKFCLQEFCKLKRTWLLQRQWNNLNLPKHICMLEGIFTILPTGRNCYSF